MNFLRINNEEIINLDDVSRVDRSTKTTVVNGAPVKMDVTIVQFAIGGGFTKREFTGEVGDQLWFTLCRKEFSTPYDEMKAPPRKPDSLIVLPAEAEIPVGETAEFTASGIYPGYEKDVTEQVTWSSTARNVANVSAKGEAKGLVEGATNIVATLDELQAFSPLTVVEAPPAPPPPPLVKAQPGNPLIEAREHKAHR